MSVVAHTVNIDFTRSDICLTLLHVPEPHTYSVVLSEVNQVLIMFRLLYGIHDKRVALTITDNGSNIVKAFDSIKKIMDLKQKMSLMLIRLCFGLTYMPPL